MERVLTYGTFDLLHPGHIHLLNRAKALGDYLIVGVSTDEFNALKHKKAYQDYSQRKFMVENVRAVDFVIPEISWEQKINDVKEYGISTFTIGDDWYGHFDFLKDYCDVVYLPKTPNISSTSIREDFDMRKIRTEEIEKELAELKSHNNVYKALFLKHKEIANTAQFISDSNITSFIGMEDVFNINNFTGTTNEDSKNGNAIIALCTDANRIDQYLQQIAEAKRKGMKVVFITNMRVKERLKDDVNCDNELIIPTRATSKSSLSAVMALQMIATEVDRLNLQPSQNPVLRKKRK